MMKKCIWVVWTVCVFNVCFAQDVAAYLDAQVVTHKYHGDGAESGDEVSAPVSDVQREHLSSSEWIKKHFLEIFSQDYINFEVHDQLISHYFNESGLTDYQAWQKKQLAVLIHHQYIVKASLAQSVDALNQTEDQSFSVPVKLMFHGYDRQFAKKIDAVNITVNVVLKSDPVNDWVISKLSVAVDDNRKDNQNPA
ncbi:MAG: hypothetical protein P8L77_04865 [Gammaproteobacteria bacterium]|nr:hypothetical protein [Gammaproteobacteria bacterium]